MKNLLILLLAVLYSFNSLSQTISGTVTTKEGEKLPWVKVRAQGVAGYVRTDSLGRYQMEVKSNTNYLEFALNFFETLKVNLKGRDTIDVVMKYENFKAKKIDYRSRFYSTGAVSRAMSGGGCRRCYSYSAKPKSSPYRYDYTYSNENYATVEETGFLEVLENPLSTFSIDVDRASYSNIRRYIEAGALPPKNAVRVEEMINYFSYDYPTPVDTLPFTITKEVTKALWNEAHYLVQIGLQTEKIMTDSLPPSNLVFLIDVSGSMQARNKLPLLKSSLKLLVSELRAVDLISIVAYAGKAGLILPPTLGKDKSKINQAISKLSSGGATAGAQGIELAYQLAKDNYMEGKNNRVILATDGDFNVGISGKQDLENLIRAKRDEGIFLSVLGFGAGNLQDAKMEVLADKGNGNYAYIDNLKEAKKVLVNEFGGTLFTVAKDVKMQVEFNPALVQAYRLIGYENRKLNKEDFNDDRKDAGEMGSGHSVTALYEVVPKGVRYQRSVDTLKYQSVEKPKAKYVNTKEMLTVKVRYKNPESEDSKLMATTLDYGVTKKQQNVNWAMSVASFGMLLNSSKYISELDYTQVQELAKKSIFKDSNGYKKEMVDLIDLVNRLNM